MEKKREWAPEDATAREVAEFASRTTQLLTGKLSKDEFRQFRLERGVYGQRQVGVQMMRIKIPYGGLTPVQLKRVAEISETHGHGVAHLTTRQDIQLHYINLSDMPRIIELLAEVDLTTREACGNTVRNVTACPYAGVCRDEAFDVTPHAHRTAQHLMRNPSTAGMGRKFKISFSGCDSSCGLAAIHDIGLIARTRTENGHEVRGFEVLVGGGLGSAPKAAQLLYQFVPETRLLPLCEAITRAFFLYGERDRRMKARMKFLIEDIGVEDFRVLVERELDGLPATHEIAPLPEVLRSPMTTSTEDAVTVDPGWLETNVYAQRQPGWFAVTVRLTLGDIEAGSLRRLAEFAADFTSDIRVTVEQNLLLRWIDGARLAQLYDGLRALGLADAGAGRIPDITVCPGADTCNLGITSSKGLGTRITSLLSDALRRFADHDIRIKISGCPNSCGQHHIADIGFFGCSLKINGRVAPAFQMLLGGHLTGESVEFARPVLKVVSNRLPFVLTAFLEDYESLKLDNETVADFIKRIGVEAIAERLEKAASDFQTNSPDLFRDWGGHSLFSLNVKQGECAGVEVDFTDALFARADHQLAQGDQYLREGHYVESTHSAYSGVIQAAKALLASRGVHATSYHQILTESGKLLENGHTCNGTSGAFRKKVEEFKQTVPDRTKTEAYLAFARSSVELIRNVSKTGAKSAA